MSLLRPGGRPGRLAVAGAAEAAALGAKLTDAVTKAQATPRGRARIALAADPAAVRSLRRTSTAGQGLGVPLLDVHTTSDQLVPVEQENAFGARVRAAGDSALLRQAYVARQSHCNFTTAETVAAVHAVQRRADTGRWTGTSAAGLQRSALALGLDGAAFVRYRPGVLVGARR
jgi:hypothetical protein